MSGAVPGARDEQNGRVLLYGHLGGFWEEYYEETAIVLVAILKPRIIANMFYISGTFGGRTLGATRFS